MTTLAERGTAPDEATDPDSSLDPVRRCHRPATSPKHHTIAGTLALIAIILAMLTFTWPVQHGGHLGITIVTGHSMEPTLHTGDIVLTWKHAHYTPGAVVVYPVPDGPGNGINVVHRLVDYQPDGTLITKGDNNRGPDPWHPRPQTVLGNQVAMIPAVGLGIDLIRRPLILALILAGIAAACAFWLVLDLTRDQPARPKRHARRTATRNRPADASRQ